MHAADEPAQRDVVRDVLDRLVGRVGIRLVVHRKDDAGDRLHEEGGERRGAERLHPVRVPRNVAEQEVLEAGTDAGALVKPVDGIEQRSLDLLLTG